MTPISRFVQPTLHHALVCVSSTALLFACGPEGEEMSNLDVQVQSVDLSINEAPCGAATIAVITDERNATYAFCAQPEGGIFAFELLGSETAESYLDTESDALALFERVRPQDAATPKWVEESLRTGMKVGDEAPFLAKARASSIGRQTFALNGSCADPATFFTDAGYHFDSFIREFANFTGQSSSYTVRDCVDEVVFQHQGWGHSVRTASAYSPTTGGTCGMYARVLGCGAGYTLLEARVRGGTSGSWTEFFGFWIPSGGFGKVKGYSNGAHSCHPSQDRDDFQLEAQSQPSSSHHFTAIYINRARNISGVCTIDPT